MGFLSKGKTGSQTPNTAHGLTIQSSAYGGAWPVVFGVTRIGMNLGWYADFAVHAPAPSGGGKGGGTSKGGKGGSAQTTYSVSFIGLLGEGPWLGIGPNVWSSQVETTMSALGYSFFEGDYAQAPWSYILGKYPKQAEGYSGFAYIAAANSNLGNSPTLSNINVEAQGFYSRPSATYPTTVPSSLSLQVPRAVVSGTYTNSQGSTVARTTVYFLSDNGVSYTGGAALTKVASSPAVGQYAVTTTGASAGTYQFNAADSGASVTISFSYAGDADPSLVVTYIATNPLSGAAFPANRLGSVVSNDQTVTIPTGLTVTPTNASGFLFNLDVVNAGTNATFKAVASSPATGQYAVDYTTGIYTFAAADVGTSVKIRYASLAGLTAYQAWCWAAQLMISPAYSTQSQASSVLDDIARLTYSEWVWESGVLQLIPRGESTVTGWGFTYTPVNTPLFNLTDDDFLPNSNATGTSAGTTSDDPVILTRKRQSDQINNIKLEFLDRANQYSPSVAEITDQGQLDKFRKRSTASQTAHLFSDITAANFSAQLLLQKEYIRNRYSFELDGRYAMLGLMDVVNIKDPKVTNGVFIPVRIVEITESDAGTLSFLAEEYPVGTGATALYTFNQGSGAQSNTNAAPTPVNAPIFLDVPVGVALGAGGSPLETWALVSGQNMSVWGGFNSHLSADGATYVAGPSQTGASRMGSSTADFPAGSDPDTVDTLPVDLTESQSSLLSGTTSDADLAHTLSAIMSHAAPLPPTLTSVNTGSLVPTTYSVRITYVFAGGVEGPSSLAASLGVGINAVLHVASPAASAGAIGWNVYAGPTPGAELLQNGSPIAIGTAWQEPTTGLYGGSIAPSSCLFELASFSDASLTATYKYNLDTYLRRGQYGTPNVDHPSGEPFGRLDQKLIKIPYTRAQIGQTFDAKFTSFNVFTGGEEDISAVTAYPHVVQGPPPLPAPTGVTVSISSGTYTISWNDLRTNPQLADAVSGYDVLYGATNLMGPVTPVVLGHQGNSITTNAIPAGSWAIYVRAVT